MTTPLLPNRDTPASQANETSPLISQGRMLANSPSALIRPSTLPKLTAAPGEEKI